MASHPALNTLLGEETLDTFPEWPSHLADRLSEIQPGLFATEPSEASPWDLGAWLEPLSERRTDFALCGFAGYGIQSMAFHLYIRLGPLILLMQTSWGAYDSAEDRAASASGAVALANDVIALAQRAQANGHWPVGKMLRIIDSDFRQSGCAWGTSSEPMPSLDPGKSILGILNELEALIALDSSP